MKKLLLLTLLLSSSMFGQLSVEQLQARIKEQKAKDIVVMYDKFKDQTTIYGKPYNLIGGMEGGAAIVFGGQKTAIVLTAQPVWIFKGRSLDKTPEAVNLVFASSSKDWLYLKGDRTVYVLYDDKRIELKAIDWDGDVNSGWTSRDTPISEYLAYQISLNDLEAISSAKSVEIKLGEKPRKFKPELLQRLSSFVRILTI
jgi:hypothetical protein